MVDSSVDLSQTKMMFRILFFLGCVSAIGLSFLASTQEAGNYDKDTLWTDDDFDLFVASNAYDKSPGIDQALLKVISKLHYDVELAAQSDMCWKCPLVKIRRSVVRQDKNVTIVVDTRWTLKLAVIPSNASDSTKLKEICLIKNHFGEHGLYMLMVDGHGGNFTCNLLVKKNPINSFIAIYVALGIVGFLAVLCTTFNCLSRKGYLKTVMFWKETENIVNSDLGSPTNVTPDDKTLSQEVKQQSTQSKRERLKSLDTFRGLSLIIMIFVNYKGGEYWFFRHIPWYGLTVADLVFPWFVFIMGTSIAIALRSQLRRGVSRKHRSFKVLKRTVILFFLGLVVSNGGGKRAVDFETLRIPGVLQRLAASYFAVAMLEVFFARVDNPYQHGKWARVCDIVPYLPEWLIAFAVVIVHLCLTLLLPVENCPTGYLGPGGLHDNGAHFNCTGGAAGYIDRKLFGEKHLYSHPTSEKIYLSTVPYDPEGALGTLTSIFMCFLGLQAGKILISYQDWVQRIHRWIIWGFITGIIAGVLCKFSANDGWIPVSKNLWSLSFVLALSSMAYFLLTILYLVIDVYNIWSGTPFYYPGMNSIVVYLCSELLHTRFPVSISVPQTHAAQLAIDLYGATVWLMLSVILYYKGIFIAI